MFSLALALGNVFFGFLSVSIWLLSILLTVSNWWHHQFFNQYFNYAAINIGKDAVEATHSISDFQYALEASYVSIMSFVFCVFAVFSGAKKVQSDLIKYIALLCILSLCLTGSGYLINTSLENNRKLGAVILQPLMVSPIHAVFVNAENQALDVESAQNFEKLLLDMNQPQYPRHAYAGSFEGYNVLVVTLESVRADFIGVYGSEYNITPYLDSFAFENTYAKNFYASSNYTSKSETSIWCGIYDHGVKLPYSTYSEDIHSINCLPGILKDKGYKTVFFHGNEAEFYGRDAFLPKVGFEKLDTFNEARVKEGGYTRLGWGLSDVDMYDYMLEEILRMNADDKPFFAHLTTLSSHYPFDWAWPSDIGEIDIDVGDPVFLDYIKAVAYQDKAFGIFWEKFKKSDLYSNTIVIVTADHGIWKFPENLSEYSSLVKDEFFFRVPFMIYMPGQGGGKVVEQVSSHIDIAPTVLSLLYPDFSNVTLLGKNLLVPAKDPWAFMMKGGELRFRHADTTCTVARDSCAGIHQGCIPLLYGELRTESAQSLQRCFRIDSDLIATPGTLMSPVVGERDWIHQGLDLIRLHNRRVFFDHK